MASEREIFDRALAIDDARERAEYLRQACGQDEALREHIEGLLQAHAKLGEFLEHPPFADEDPTVDQSLVEGPGAVVGPYRLLQKIGEGGFGLVYMAEQAEPVERRVALKIIKPGMDSRQVIARFEAEEQALAMMDHPNIARVFDAGITDSGRPYFVMELVKGVPITTYCDERHLTPRERLELFVPVCRAVQHAHQKGIIHRDLKPSNVLVALYDDKPVPKVIDFGVAKATSQKLTERTMFTQYGQIVGTLEYMSPEQANLNQLDIDTRSDIYSLGVLLYELLTGETPFDRRRLRSAAFDEMLRIIREEEPPRPSLRLSTSETLPSIAANRHIEPKKLSTLVRGELDWIVMKALEKDRSRRYETANGLADDIERFLHDEPVTACPPSAAYRFRKFARRNKVPLAVVSLAAFALIAVATGAGIAAARFRDLARRNADLATEKQTALTSAIAAEGAATKARDQETAEREEAQRQTKIAEDALADVERQRQRAEANYSLARSSVDKFLNRVTENELLTVPGLQPLRRELLSSALEFYDRFTRDAANASASQVELAAAYYRIGVIYLEMDDGGRADECVSKSIELFEKLRDGGNHSLEVRLGLAKAYFARKRHIGVLHRDAVALCQSILETDAKHAETRRLLANMYQAAAFASRENTAIALEHQQQALALCEGLVRDFPANPEYLGEWGSCLHQQGNLVAREGKNREALAMFERAVSYFAEAYRGTPNTIRWGRSLGIGLQGVADKQAELGNQQEALRSYERLVAVRRKLAFDNPAVSSLKSGLYRAYLALGNYQKQLGDAAAANRSFRAAQEVLENIPREEPDQLFELATVYGALATPEDDARELTQQDRDDRQRYADLAMEMIVKAVERDYDHFFQRRDRLKALQSHKDLAVLRQRADFRQLVGKLEKEVRAEELAVAETGADKQKLADRRQAIDTFRELIGDDPRQLRHQKTLAETLQSSGELQIGLREYDEAEKSLHEALEIRKRFLEEQRDDPYEAMFVLAAERSLGLLDWAKQDYLKAQQRWRRCLAESLQLAQASFRDDEHMRSALQLSLAEEERKIYQHYGGCGLWPLVRELATRYANPDHGIRLNADKGVVSDAELSAVILGHNDRQIVRNYFQELTGTLRSRDRLAEQWRSPDFRSTSRSILHAVRSIAALGEGDLLTEHLLARAKTIFEEEKMEPKSGWTAVCQAILLYHQGRFAEARSVLEDKEDTLQLAFLDAAVAAKLGDKKRAQERWSEAEARYRQTCGEILALDAAESVAQKYGGSWWEFAYDQAMRRTAFEATSGGPAPDDPWQRLIQARGYRLIGEKERAEEDLAAAVAANPKDWELWAARARLFSKWGEYDRARVDWQKVVDLAGDDPVPWTARGRWYAERGEREKAEADFAKAASLTPAGPNKSPEAGQGKPRPEPRQTLEPAAEAKPGK